MAESNGPSAAGNAAPSGAAPAATPAPATSTSGGQEAAAAVPESAVQLPTPPPLPGVWDSGYGQNDDENAKARGDESPVEALVDGAQKPDDKPATFKFGGQEWESQEKAEQNFKTLRGQFRAKEAARQEAAASAHEATTAAFAWKAEADRLQQELNQYQSGNTSGQSPVQGDGTPKDPQAAANPLQAIDWSLYQTLHDDHGPKVAAAWLYEQTLNALSGQLDKRVNDKVDPVLDPIKSREQQLQEGNQLIAAFQESAALKFDDGSPVYPELTDGRATRDIGTILMQLELPTDVSHSHRGIHLAVVTYRDRMARAAKLGQSNQPTTVQPGVAGQTAGQVEAAGQAANAAASGVISGVQPPATPRPPATAAEGTEMALRASIKNAGNFRNDLGFAE